MRVVIIITLLFCGTVHLHSIEYSFDYDNAGNRVDRTMVDINGKEAVQSKTIAEYTVDIYPNPTLGELNVVFSNKDNQSDIRIEVFDLEGKSLINKVYNNNDVWLDLSNNSNGTYIMKITIEDESIEYKIIKSN